MKLMRLAACAVAFAVVGGIVVAEDMDIRALQAKLAAQEARLNDLQAKMGSGSAETPASIISLKKNAKVTIGGDIDVRYIYDSYTAETNYDYTAEIPAEQEVGEAYDTGTAEVVGALDNRWRDTAGVNQGNLFVDTADLRVAVDVNENFDAFMRLGGHDNGRNTGVIRDAWFRWKNICNSGWGVLIGRNGVQFGMGKPAGMFDAWMQDDAARSGWAPEHFNYGVSRTTQINPYWESQDGKFRFDISFFQGLESRNGSAATTVTNEDYIDAKSANWGLGSGTIKLQWKPTEEWTFVGAFAHLYANAQNGDEGLYGYGDERKGALGAWDDDTNSNSNTAFHLGFIYNPAAFCQKLNIWAQATKEFNAGFITDRDYFDVNVGLSYAFTEKLTAFAMGDYMTASKYKKLGIRGDVDGWRSYLGVNYNMANGVNFEAGWSHDELDLEENTAAAGLTGRKASISGNTLYTKLAFSF